MSGEIEYLNKYLCIAQDEGDRATEAWAYDNLGEVHQSLGHFEIAADYHMKSLAIAKEKGYRDQEGLAYGNLGNSNHNLGNFIRALEYHEQCLAIARELGDVVREGQAYGNLGNAYQSLGDFRKATEYHNKFLSIAKEVGAQTKKGVVNERLDNGNGFLDSLGETVTYNAKDVFQDYHERCLSIAKEVVSRAREGLAYANLGNTYQSLGDFNTAKECHNKCLKIFREVGDRAREGNAYGNLGQTFNYLGDFQNAIEYQQQCLQIAKEVGDKAREGHVYGDLGKAYHSLGDFSKAIKYEEECLEIAKEIGSKAKEGHAYGDLGRVYQSLGDFLKAKEYQEHCLKIAKEIGDKAKEGHAYGDLGRASQSLCDFEMAMEYQEQCLEIAKEIGDKAKEGHAYGDLGRAYQRLGAFQMAIEYQEQCLAIAKEIGDRAREGHAYGDLGEVYQSRNNFQKAIEYQQQCLEIAKETGCKVTEGWALGNLGNDYESLGRSQKDCSNDKTFCDSLVILHRALECYQTGVKVLNVVRDDLQSHEALKIRFREIYDVLYGRLWKLLLYLGRIQEALHAAEQGRGQALIDRMKILYGIGEQSLEAEETISYISNKLTAQTVFLAVQQNEINFWVLSKNEKLHLRYWKTRGGESAKDFLRNVLRKILIKIADDHKGDGDGNGDGEDDLHHLLQLLYDALIKPVEDLCQSDELVFVPEGPLCLVPFSALSKSIRIRSVPSLTALRLITNSPDDFHDKDGILLVGDPCVHHVRFNKREFHQRPLAKKEVEMIANLLKVPPLTGKEATKDEVLRRISSVSLIHFATHARKEGGEIVLAPNHGEKRRFEKKDFILSMSDLLATNVRAKLVVLSYGRGALGKIVMSEGVLGMARAFLAAGARSVLASVWPIDDGATLEFMKSFYEHLCVGQSVSVALQRAMNFLRCGESFCDAKYWAPFVLIGDDVTFEFGALKHGQQQPSHRPPIKHTNQLDESGCVNQGYKSSVQATYGPALVQELQNAENLQQRGDVFPPRQEGFALPTDQQLMQQLDKIPQEPAFKRQEGHQQPSQRPPLKHAVQLVQYGCVNNGHESSVQASSGNLLQEQQKAENPQHHGDVFPPRQQGFAHPSDQNLIEHLEKIPQKQAFKQQEGQQQPSQRPPLKHASQLVEFGRVNQGYESSVQASSGPLLQEQHTAEDPKYHGDVFPPRQQGFAHSTNQQLIPQLEKIPPQEPAFEQREGYQQPSNRPPLKNASQLVEFGFGNQGHKSSLRASSGALLREQRKAENSQYHGNVFPPHKQGYVYTSDQQLMQQLDKIPQEPAFEQPEGHKETVESNSEHIRYFNKCLVIARRERDEKREGWACENIGNVYQRLGSYHQAIEYHHMFLLIAKQLGDKGAEGRAYGGLGSSYDGLGSFEQAEKYHEWDRDIAIKRKNRVQQGWAYSNLGRHYLAQGTSEKLRDAMDCHEKEMNLAKEDCNRIKMGQSNWTRNLSYGALQKFHGLSDYRTSIRSIEYHERRVAITKDVETKARMGRAYGNRGNVHQRLGDFKLAVDNLEKALEIAKEVVDSVGEGRVHSALGLLYHKKGIFEKAIEYHTNDLSIARAMGDKVQEGRAYHNIGNAHFRLNNFQTAVKCYHSSVRLFNIVRADIARGSLRNNEMWEISFRTLCRGAYLALWTTFIKLGQMDEALYAAERGRAQALVDDLKTQYGLTELASASLEPRKIISEISNKLRTQIVFLAVERNEINFWVISKGNKMEFRRKTVEAICEEENAIKVWLEANLKESGARDRVRCENRTIDEPSDDDDDDYRGEPKLSRSVFNSLQPLCEVIIDPIADLCEGQNELIIIPDGHLCLAPVSALSESIRIRTVPSLTSLKLIIDSPQKHHCMNGALLVGDPCLEPENKPLPSAREEVHMIGEILNITPLTGAEATKQEVLEQMKSKALIHIAAHGRSETGEIALAPNPGWEENIDHTSSRFKSGAKRKGPKEEDFMLKMSDVLAVQLRARLVVLSCCHSGRGQVKSEGVVGIARAFLAAGARSVLVSLWAISDKVTKVFMKIFYQHLFDGEKASVALQQAMKSLRDSEEFSAVKHWAPFVLIGDDVTLSFGEQDTKQATPNHQVRRGSRDST